jgi:diacylglycerol kinase family enzyme
VSDSIAVIVNAAAGTGGTDAGGSALEDAFKAAGAPVTVHVARSGAEVRSATERAIGSDIKCIVAAGGDGTVSTVAGALAGRDITLGVIPLGTLNHFARDLGIPLEVAAAAATILGGHTVQVDVGDVNGRIFLNNSSLGLYPHFVRLRSRFPARGAAKWIVGAWAALTGILHYPQISVTIEADGKTLIRRTPILFIGNNEYRTTGLTGSRDSLSDGFLALYVVGSKARRHLLGIAWKLMRGRALEFHELELVRVTAATIDLKASRAHVALDGEVEMMTTPLKYRIRRGALKVLVPSV